MQEHLIFNLPHPAEGIFVSVNGVTIPATRSWADQVIDNGLEHAPWTFVEPSFADTFELPSGANIMELLKNRAPVRSRSFEDMGGGSWYFNTLTGDTCQYTTDKMLHFEDDASGQIAGNLREMLVVPFGPELASSVGSCFDLLRMGQTGKLETIMREVNGIPADLPTQLISVESDSYTVTVTFNDGSELPPHLSESYFDTHAELFGYYLTAIEAVGRAVGDPYLADKNRDWLKAMIDNDNFI